FFSFGSTEVLAVKRREFITLLGGAAAAWPLSARAQQTTPLIRFLNAQAPKGFANLDAAFHLGLEYEGLLEGGNVWVEYRWGEREVARLPGLAADLVRRWPCWSLLGARMRRASQHPGPFPSFARLEATR